MKLSGAVRRKLGQLVDLADDKVADLIRARGGNASNVREAGHWGQRSLGEAATAAVAGDATADKAVKLVKDAGRLGRKYGGDRS